MSRFSKTSLGRIFLRGFTLIELLVSISIVTIIATVVIVSQSTYTDQAALSALGDEVSSTLSQAQVYSVSVREFATGSDIFYASYGLVFSLLSSGSNSSYIYFADRDGDRIYDDDWSCIIGGTSECLNKTNLVRGNIIAALCVVPLSGTENCDVGRVDISFTRPDTGAQFQFFDPSGSPLSPSSLKGARITFQSPKGSLKSVLVFSTGQISVE